MQGGLPQFDPSSFAGQIFWLAMCFAALYVLLRRVALPRIAYVVESRAQHIAQDLAHARDASNNAASITAAFEAEMVTARSTAQQQIGAAQHQAALAHSAALGAQGQKLTAEIMAAEQRISVAKTSAMATLAPAASAAAAAMITKFAAGQVVGADKINAAVAKHLPKVA